MKKFKITGTVLGIAVILIFFATQTAADLYEEAKAGVEPYATHFAEAENLCLELGYSYPGFVVPPLPAKLQEKEMNLCIEREINSLLNQEEIINERLLEIEQKIQELLEARKDLLS